MLRLVLVAHWEAVPVPPNPRDAVGLGETVQGVSVGEAVTAAVPEAHSEGVTVGE